MRKNPVKVAFSADCMFQKEGKSVLDVKNGFLKLVEDVEKLRGE